MKNILYLLILCTIPLGCQETRAEKEVNKSKALIINQISEHVYQHISFLETENFGKVSCNGMIVACKNV